MESRSVSDLRLDPVERWEDLRDSFGPELNKSLRVNLCLSLSSLPSLECTLAALERFPAATWGMCAGGCGVDGVEVDFWMGFGVWEMGVPGDDWEMTVFGIKSFPPE